MTEPAFVKAPTVRLQQLLLNADQALRRQNMTGDELLKLAYQSANHYANRHPTFPASRIEDLAMFCCETVLRRASGYDPAKNTGFDQARNPSSSPFKSWCWMVMSNACLDFVRRRNEGFAGRLGRDKPITVTIGLEQDHEEDTDLAVDELAMKRTDTQRWRDAASRQGLSLEQFIRQALDEKAAA